MSRSERELSAVELWPYLQQCGYGSSTVLRDLPLPGSRAATFAGFAQRPFDSRSACFAAVDVVTTPLDDAKACRHIGAPITFLCHQDYLLWWSQTDVEPYQVGKAVPSNQLEGFFRIHSKDFAPGTIYRAKTLGRFEVAYQRTFVDLGLMPLVEKEAGEAIERLLLDSVAELRELMGWPRQVDLQQGRWLVKSVFWLLGAKMLHDKGVEGFVRINFKNVDDVFSRLVTHYGESPEGLITTQVKRRALEFVAQRIATSADLQLATTEALAYVYENTLISDEIRAEFGTHSTPSYLVDYIVGRLEPWIRQIEPERRNVFEPACGHAAFLVAAIRLLTSLLSPERAEPAARKKYLRDRVRGFDVDDFAIEIARLSLTLTDIPNPNGWTVKVADLLKSNLIEKTASDSMILLANTPFEDLRPSQRAEYARNFQQPKFLNKTSEMLYRAISAMPEGGIFGVVVPQSLLHEANASQLRKLLIQNCELQEVCVFPDKVFNFADQESAVLIGRKFSVSSRPSERVLYRRVREREMEWFRNSYDVTSEVCIDQREFEQAEDFDLRVPDLRAVWQECALLPKLAQFVNVGQGFSHIGEVRSNFPAGAITVTDEPFEGGVEGFQNLGSEIQTHQLPPLKWLNLSEDVLNAPRSGTKRGIPQILLNEAPVQRAPWCLRAMIDEKGHPAKSSFTILRPLSADISLDLLWGLLNSPIANAYAYSHSSKRHILTGTWRKFPVPDFNSLRVSGVETAVQNYFGFINRQETQFQLRGDNSQREEQIRELHWRIDAEVLELYGLPSEVERQLLDYFAGWERVGVPFKQNRYFPEGFEEPISLRDFLAITTDWEATNDRRYELIAAEETSELNTDESMELQNLQRLAGLKRELLSSPPLRELIEIEANLRKRQYGGISSS